MSTGSMFGGNCYPTQQQAAVAACSSWLSYASDGSYTRCVGMGTNFVPSSSSGGTAYVGLNLTVVPGPASSAPTQSIERNIVVQACERYDYEYWSPAITAWVTAIATVIAAKVLWTRIFSRETL